MLSICSMTLLSIAFVDLGEDSFQVVRKFYFNQKSNGTYPLETLHGMASTKFTNWRSSKYVQIENYQLLVLQGPRRDLLKKQKNYIDL